MYWWRWRWARIHFHHRKDARMSDQPQEAAPRTDAAERECSALRAERDALVKERDDLLARLEQWNNVMVEAARIAPESYLNALAKYPEFGGDPVVIRATEAALSSGGKGAT